MSLATAQSSHVTETFYAPQKAQEKTNQKECPFHAKTQVGKRKTNTQVIEDTKAWMARQLPCIAGRREVNRGRYMVRTATKLTVPEIFTEYKSLLEKGQAVACLYVFNDERYYEGRSETSNVFHYLADQMQGISTVPANELATGAALTNSIELRCPVTNELTLYDDFESIAFCPQSGVRTDMLYDPLMYAPYPAVNMSSDVYAFSQFVADSAISAWGKPVYEENDITRVTKLFSQCVARWQRVATTTIRNYEAITDTAICPVHVTDDEHHWIAFHKDPAFAEQIKEVHKHELPIGYGTRITNRWLQYFSGDIEFQATGLARDGEPI